MSVRNINIFISHSWAYSDHYSTLEDWIFNGSWRVGSSSLNFRDFSVPKNDPIHNAGNDTELQKAIYNKIARSHIVVIPSGMYSHHSKWIRKEIEGAKLYDKPILAVNPFGQEKKSGIVLNNADMGVGWNKKPVINAIWQLFKNKNE